MPRMKNRLGGTILIAGLALVLVALLADEIGIGNEPGFGWKQLIGLVVGAVVVLVGLRATRGDDAESGEANS